MPITRTSLLLAAIMFLSCTVSSPIRAGDFTENERFIREVFTNIITAIDGKEGPYLEVVPGKGSRDGLESLSSTISLGEDLAEIARRFGKDSANVLALFIGHEVAHYYRGHGYGGVEISDSEFQNVIRKVDNKAVKKEVEADYFIGFYGRMAGYEPFEKASQAMEVFYKEYRFSYASEQYPDLGRRKSVMGYVNGRLKALGATFDAANYLSMIREYDRAQQCYDHISSIFWSREMLNNAGVSSTLNALQLMDSQSVSYVYPLELDVDTRLRGIVRAERAPDAIDSARIQVLLASALSNFKRAIRCDKNYAAAKINLATVLILKERYDDGIRLIDEVLRNNKSDFTKVLAETARSIALLRKGETKAGRDGLKQIQNLAKEQRVEELVNENLNSIERARSTKPRKREKPGQEESIDGLYVRDTSTVWPPLHSEKIGDQREVHNRTIGFGTMTFVVQDTTRILFIQTEKGYDETSANGIKIGSTEAEVLERYSGEPRIINARQGKFYIYDYAKVIFLLDPFTDTVKQWMIYSIY